MKKILHWNTRFGNTIGGGEIYIANIIQNMPELNHYVLSDKYMPGTRNEYYKDFKKNIYYSKPPYINTPRFLTFPINILTELIRDKIKKSILKKIMPDLNIIHGLGLFNSLERLDFSMGIDLINDNYFREINPKILTVHNLLSVIISKNKKRYSDYEKKIFEQFDTLICVDKIIYSYLKKKYPSKEIYFVPNSIPDYFFSNEFKEERYNPKSPILGFVGRYESSRGLSILKEMIEKSPKYFKFILIFSTSLGSKRRIISEFHKYKNIELHLNILNKKIPSYYQKMDFLFNPVISEGISRVSLEAMANSVLPIMIDMGDRYPVQDFETGILFKKEDLDDLIDKIKKLSSEKYYEMQKKTNKIAKEEFSNLTLIPKLKEIYMKHING